jgi:glycosyltransferase involved in cell wall biosynthesis
LFVDAIEIAKERDANIEALVCGEGALTVSQERLRELGIEFRNHWIADRDIAEILASCDVMLASHTEASQSGIVAAAFGSGMPVIATPVGGLREQVSHGETGRIAREVSAEAIADEILHLYNNPLEIEFLNENIARQRGGRSMQHFLSTLLNRAKQHIGGQILN